MPRIAIALALAAAGALVGCTDAGQRPAEPRPAARPNPFGWINPARQVNLAGMEAYHRGDYERARAAFDEAIELKPETAAYHANAGLAEQALYNWDRAARHYHVATQLDPALVGAYLGQAQCLLARGEPGRALAVLEAGAGANPRTGQAYVNVAKYHAVMGDLRAARHWLARAVVADPGNPRVHREYAALLARLGETDKATGEMEKARQLEPAAPAARP
jgi:tetratricopeptide (TPR) repeat protein